MTKVIQAWRVTENGNLICNEDFTFDAMLKLDGDFADDAQRIQYAEAIASKLNSALESVRSEAQQWKERATKNEQRRWELAQQSLALVALIKAGREIGQSREAYDFQLCLAAKRIEDACPTEAALQSMEAVHSTELRK